MTPRRDVPREAIHTVGRRPIELREKRTAKKEMIFFKMPETLKEPQSPPGGSGLRRESARPNPQFP